MGIKWGDALLAGAAGVAEYSNEKQALRQNRMDKLFELQSAQKMEMAKSAYAVKMNEHTQKKALYNKLQGVKAGSMAEQIILAKAKGMGEEEARRHALMTRKKPSLLMSRNTLDKPPVFEMPELGSAQKATSPIYDWVQNYLGEGANTQEELMEVAIEGEAPTDPTAPTDPAEPTEPTDTAAPSAAPDPAAPAAAPTATTEDADLYQEMFGKKQKWSVVIKEKVIDGERKLIAEKTKEDGTTEVEIIKFHLGSKGLEAKDFVKIQNGDTMDIYVPGKEGKLELVQSLDSPRPPAAPTKEPAAVLVGEAEVDRSLMEGGIVDTVLRPFLDSTDYKMFASEDQISASDQEVGDLKRKFANTYLTTVKNLQKSRGSATESIKYLKQDRMKATAMSYANTFEPEQLAKMVANTDEPLDVSIFKDDAATLLAIRDELPTSPTNSLLIKEINKMIADASIDHTKKAPKKRKVPKKGDIINGYRFVGGDPNDKNNYVKV